MALLAAIINYPVNLKNVNMRNALERFIAQILHYQAMLFSPDSCQFSIIKYIMFLNLFTPRVKSSIV